MDKLTCFKAYDIRGVLESEINEDVAYRIGRAYGEVVRPKKVVVGGDIRLTSESLKHALSDGLMDAGVDVIDLGLTGTEEIYFATRYFEVCGGIEVTASHNPINYNGMKLVGKDAKPISRSNGLSEIQKLAEENSFGSSICRGHYSTYSIVSVFVDHLMTYLDIYCVRPLKIVVNSGNGAAGHVIDEIENRFISNDVPVEFIKVNHNPDGSFPNGVPNPLLPENRAETAKMVVKYHADIGIAWDGDFDRCFFFDEKGNFIEGYYIVGLLAEAFLQKRRGAKIIYDPRLTWNTVEVVKENGGVPVLSKTGHAFIKEKMREEDAEYGGEMSAHHYFKSFGYCDSGMIPWILIVELISRKQLALSELVLERIVKFPSSGEINIIVSDTENLFSKVKQKYTNEALKIEEIDGISLEFDNWRFNLRSSNTEPVVRLNVESRGDVMLMEEKTRELLKIIKS